MGWEDQSSIRYEAELAAIARLDRAYYLNPCPSRTERSNYAARQVQLEKLRSRFYAELAASRQHGPNRLCRCRSIIRSCRPEGFSARSN